MYFHMNFEPYRQCGIRCFCFVLQKFSFIFLQLLIAYLVYKISILKFKLPDICAVYHNTFLRVNFLGDTFMCGLDNTGTIKINLLGFSSAIHY
jgi:hypothetical protein